LPPVTHLRAGRIHPLTSLRFFAALSIVFFHTIPTLLPGFPPGQLGQRWLSAWPVAVSFFFFLSGYILSVVYLSGGKQVQARNFWSARFARIYPLFLIALIMDVPNVIFWRIPVYGLMKSVVITAATFLYDLTLLQAWTPHIRIICTPNWSLSVEAMFYALFPFLAPLLWKLRGRKIWLSAIFIYAGGQALVGVVATHFDKLIYEWFPIFHLSTFLLGVLLARWQEETGSLLFSSQARELRTYGTLSIAAIIYVLVVANVAIHIPYALVHDGLLAPVFACLIWSFSRADTSIARIFSASWLVVLGEASYGLYLIHAPVWWYFIAIFHAGNVRIWYPFYFSACVGLSVLSFFFFEAPIRKRILQRLASRPHETMEVASDAQ